MPLKQILNYKSLLLAGLLLNVVLMIYVYFIVDGGPASVQQSGDWMAILNEVPITLLFFLAAVFKPYLMVWSKCKKNISIALSAGATMFTTTAIACIIIFLTKQAMIKDLTMYINWALLWGASAYFVLVPQRVSSGDE